MQSQKALESYKKKKIENVKRHFIHCLEHLFDAAMQSEIIPFRMTNMTKQPLMGE